MQPISDLVKFLLTIISTISAVLFGHIFTSVQPNLAYWVKKIAPWEKTPPEVPSAKPLTTWTYFGLALVVWAVSAGISTTAPSTRDVTTIYKQMSGDYRVVVLPFSVSGKELDDELGYEVATDVFERLTKAMEGTSSDLVISVWGPEDLEYGQGEIKSADRTKRATDAADISRQINTDLVIYGIIEKTTSGVSITPEFYIRTRNFYQADEILGQYNLGLSVLIRDYSDVSDRVKFTEAMRDRTQALSQIILGLAYYSIQDYPGALGEFLIAEQIETWQSTDGKQVLFLLMANAAVRQDDLDKAEVYFQKALDIDPSYARPLVGLANIYYRRALLPIEASNNPKDLDLLLIDKAQGYLDEALSSENQPPLADVPVKVYFEQGEINFMLKYSGFADSYDPAIDDFTKVLIAYGDGTNLRIQERAAEAHARLGLIYSLTGDLDTSISEYEKAVLLLEEYPDRQQLFMERIRKLSGTS